MTAAVPASELLPLPRSGRRFTIERTVRLSDVDAGGSLRFDAISRYLQDVASDDAIDAGLPNAMGWVVRRTMIRIDQTCALGERLSATTFCTGVGRSWAERRSSLVGSDGGAVEAVSLWIQVDVDTGRPTRLGDEFFGTYGESAGGRTVSSRLSLDSPTDSTDRSGWSFRPTDIDPFDHVNNAAQWAVFESTLDLGDRHGVAEVEYQAPAGLEELSLLVDGRSLWLVDGDRTLTAFRWSPAS